MTLNTQMNHIYDKFKLRVLIIRLKREDKGGKGTKEREQKCRGF